MNSTGREACSRKPQCCCNQPAESVPELEALEPAPPCPPALRTDPQKEPEQTPVTLGDNPEFYSIKIHLFTIWKEHFHASVPSSLPSIAPAVFCRHSGEIKQQAFKHQSSALGHQHESNPTDPNAFCQTVLQIL